MFSHISISKMRGGGTTQNRGKLQHQKQLWHLELNCKPVKHGSDFTGRKAKRDFRLKCEHEPRINKGKFAF